MAKPHEVLGIAADASFDEARAAFKRLAMKHHPDRNGGDDAQFKHVLAAFEALRSKRAAVGVFDDIFTDIGKKQHG